MRTYKLAFSTEAGELDVVETFEAADDAAANRWAAENEARMREQYHNDEWYVLDEHGHNING